MVTNPLQPTLVLPVYRGGPRFLRALDSVNTSEQFFHRIVVSSNGPESNDDINAVNEYKAHRIANGQPESKIELINTGEELPWMGHQYFWLNYLEQTNAQSDDWVYWFAHDDEVKASGIEALIDDQGNWPLEQGTIYLGPWAMRHEQGDELFSGPRDIDLESWTSFPIEGPLELPVAEWIAQQLIQPTYINMSGCVTTLRSFQEIRKFKVAKPGGMRIEMATAAAPHNLTVKEFDAPIVITYGRPNSDRTQYAKVARQDDKHMIAWLTHYISKHPSAAIPSTRAALKVGLDYIKVLTKTGKLPDEDWRRRNIVGP